MFVLLLIAAILYRIKGKLLQISCVSKMNNYKTYFNEQKFCAVSLVPTRAARKDLIKECYTLGAFKERVKN